jgi:hypothetical protein
MKPSFALFCSKQFRMRRTGFALVVALTAIVLITVIVLAFFSKAMLNRQISFTSTNQIKSDMLARSALDIVVGEIRQEIIDYSNVTNEIYVAKQATNIVPIKTGVNGADPTVGSFTITKVSAPDTKIDPDANGKAFGSTASLGDQSRNGRTLSQWFLSGPKLGTATLPTWSYLSRNGTLITNVTNGASSPKSTNFVVGRFSYTVYNVGGLLDANVAGYRNNIVATNYGGKSSLAYADLTALGLTASQADNLVKWRNATTGADTNLFNAWAAGLTITNTPAEKKSLAAAHSGYLEAAHGDNVFFSRRDLLRYLNANAITNASSSLTHFSRALSAPSWGPTNVPGSSISYGDDANKTSSINRFIPGVKAFNGVINDYSDTGLPTTRAVHESDPLVQKKFSLAKLAWIGHNGPNVSAFDSSLSASQRALAIKTSFGLTWNSTKKRWDYSHGARGILTLDEVRGEKRAPDFFELLKAGILDGSLGQHPGIVALDISWKPIPPRQEHSMTTAEKLHYWQGPAGSHYETYSADRDRHILQIGANIIDQADNNNFPTALFLEMYNQPSFSPSENELNNTVFGQENLPGIQRLRNWTKVNGPTPVQVTGTKADGNQITNNWPELAPLGVWMQPEIWNPYDSATAGNSANPLNDPNYPTPTALRIVTLGKVYLWNYEFDKDMNSVKDTVNPDHDFAADEDFCSDTIDFGSDLENPSQDGIVCFKNPRPSSTQPRSFFDDPVPLTGGGAASAQINYFDATSPSGPENLAPPDADWLANSTRFLGVYLGEVLHDGDADGFAVRAIPDLHLSFVLQYFDGSDWRSYAVYNRLESLRESGGSSNSRWGQSSYSSSNAHIDPRTDRFSGSAIEKSAGQINVWHGGSVRMGPGKKLPGSPNGNVEGNGRNPIKYGWPRPSAGFTHMGGNNMGTTSDISSLGTLGASGFFLFDEWMRNIPEAGWTGNDANRPRFWYADPDGVIRPGDGFRGSGWEVANSGDDTGDGMLTYSGSDSRVIASKTRRKPVILNRPFRSVGELGYVFRDLPFKSLDFWSDLSADSGLLDLFSVSDEPLVTAGKITLNSAPASVLEAVLSKTLQHNGETNSIASAEAKILATELASTLSAKPLAGRGDLAQLNTAIQTAFSNSTLSNSMKTANKANKAYAEAPIRALASVSNIRTWNLLVDVVAQSGMFPPNSSDLASSFIVQGERRYWLHIAIDRLTGEIVDSQLEQVYE